MLLAAVKGGHWQLMSTRLFAALREHPVAQRVWLLYCGKLRYTGRFVDHLRIIFGSTNTDNGFRRTLRLAVARVAEIAGRIIKVQTRHQITADEQDKISVRLNDLTTAAAGYGIGVAFDAAGNWRWALEPSPLLAYLRGIAALARG